MILCCSDRNTNMAAATQQMKDSRKSDESDDSDEDEKATEVRSRGSIAGIGQESYSSKATKRWLENENSWGMDSHVKKSACVIAASSGKLGSSGSSVAAATAAAPVRRSESRLATSNARMMLDGCYDEKESRKQGDVNAMMVEASVGQIEEFVPMVVSTRM